MLFGSPPGYSPPAVNRQNIGPFGTPGSQSAGSPPAVPGSSYLHTPSSAAIPSSVPAGNTNILGAANMPNVVRALQNRRV